MGEKTHRIVDELRVFLFTAALVTLLVAACKPAKADDESSAKSSPAAYLRIPLTAKMFPPTSGQNLQAAYDIYKNTQKQLLLNPLVLNAAVKKPSIGDLSIVKNEKEPADWLSRNLEITFPGNAEIMKVSLAVGDPKQRALLVNAVVDAYFSEVVDAERKKKEERLSELQHIRITKQQEIKDSLNELRNMARNLGTSDSDTLNIQQKNTLDELQLLREEFLRQQFDVNRMNVQLAGQKAVLDTLENEPLTDIECQLLCPNDVILNKVLEEMVDLCGTTDPKDIAKSKELQKKYAERIEQLRQGLTKKRTVEIKTEIKKLEASIEMAQRQLEPTSEELKRLRKDADRIGISTIDMQIRRTSIATAQKSLDSLTTEVEALRIESQTAPSITILQKAEVP